MLTLYILLVFVLLFSFIYFSDKHFNKQIQGEISALLSSNDVKNTVIPEEALNDLPGCVKRWLHSSGIINKPAIDIVYLKQQAEIKLRPGGKWLKANAEQYYRLNNPAFIWKVKVFLIPFLFFTGYDKYKNGKGKMLIKFLSLKTIVNSQGKEIDESELLRFLAEICWFPTAALSPLISWQEINANSALATMQCNGLDVSATFSFNSDNDIIAIKAMRYRSTDNGPEKAKWAMRLYNWSNREGVRIPIEGKVSWLLDTGAYSYYRWKIKQIAYNSLKTSPASKQLKQDFIKI